MAFAAGSEHLTQFIVCNLPKRLGGLSMNELKDLCRENGIQATKANNFLKTKRDVCIELTLTGAKRFQLKVLSSRILDNDKINHDDLKLSALKQIDETIKNNAEQIKQLNNSKVTLGKEVRQLQDNQHDILKQNSVLEVAAPTPQVQNLKNQFNSKVENLADKLSTLEEKKSEIDKLHEELRVKNQMLALHKTQLSQMSNNPVTVKTENGDIENIKMNILQMQKREFDIERAISELQDHSYRLRNEVSKSAKTDQRSVDEKNAEVSSRFAVLSTELNQLHAVKQQLESQNISMKSQLPQLMDANRQHETKIKEYVDLLSRKDVIINQHVEEIAKLQQGNEHQQADIDKFKKSLKEVNLDLSKYREIFPTIEEAKELADSRHNLDERANKIKNLQRSVETQINKVWEKVEKLDDETAVINQTFKTENGADQLASMFAKIDKVLSKYAETDRETASLQRQIKASDAKVKEFHADFVTLLRMTDEKIQLRQDDATKPGSDVPNRSEISAMFEKLKDYISNTKFLSKALEDLRKTQLQTSSKSDKINEKMKSISGMLDIAEREASQSQSDNEDAPHRKGGAGQNSILDDILGDLSSFESRVKSMSDERRSLKKEIGSLKQALKKSADELKKTQTGVNVTLGETAQAFKAQLATVCERFVKNHRSLVGLLDAIDKSTETPSKKFSRLRSDMSELLKSQTKDLEEVQKIYANLGFNSALQRAINLDIIAASTEPAGDVVTDTDTHTINNKKHLDHLKKELSDSVNERDETARQLAQSPSPTTSVIADLPDNASLLARKSELEQSYRALEAQIAGKVNEINRLQSELVRIQSGDNERLQQIKSSLEEAYAKQIKARDDSILRLTDELHGQQTASRDQLESKEKQLKTEADERIGTLMKQVDHLKENDSNDEAILEALNEKTKTLEGEKRLHEKFASSLREKDQEIMRLQDAMQNGLINTHRQYESDVTLPPEAMPMLEKSERHMQLIDNVRELGGTWQAQYDTLQEQYTDMKAQYEKSLQDVRAKNIERETEMVAHTQQKAEEYAEAVTKAKQLESINELYKRENETLNVKGEQILSDFIEARKELEKLRPQFAELQNVKQVYEQNKELKEREKDHELTINEKDAELRALNFHRDKLSADLDKQRVALYEQDDLNRHITAQKVEMRALQTLAANEKVTAIKHEQEEKYIKEKLDEIRAAVGEFSGYSVLESGSGQKIKLPDTPEAAVQAVKDIAYDYRWVRQGYDKIVGKLRDNIATLVKTITNTDELNLAKIDDIILKETKEGDARAQLKIYKTMMYDELKKEADRRYEEARLTALTFGAEDSFRDTEHEIDRLFESRSTPQFFQEKLRILNLFIVNMNQTREKVRSLQFGPLQGSRENKEEIHKKLKILLNSLPALSQRLKAASDLAHKFLENPKDTYHKDELMQTINSIANGVNEAGKARVFGYHGIKAEFQANKLFDKKIQNEEFINHFDKSVEDYCNALLAAAQSIIRLTGITDAQLKYTSQNSKSKIPEEANPMRNVFEIVKGAGDSHTSAPVKENSNIRRLRKLVEIARSDLEKLIVIAIGGSGLTSKPLMTSYQQDNALEDNEKLFSDPISQYDSFATHGVAPTKRTEDTKTTNFTDKDFDRCFAIKDLKNYIESVNLWPGNSMESYTAPTPDNIKEVFDEMNFFAIRAWVQNEIWKQTVNNNPLDVKRRFKEQHCEKPALKNHLSSILKIADNNTPAPHWKNLKTLLDISKNATETQSRLHEAINDIERHSSGGAISSGDNADCCTAIDQLRSQISKISKQRSLSTSNLKYLLGTIEHNLSMYLKFRPKKRTFQKGGVDEIIKVKSVPAYDVDKLNVVLESINKLVQHELKQLKRYKLDSEEGKSLKNRLEKLDNLLVERDVFIEQLREICDQSVDRALTLEEELLKRDRYFDSLKQLLLGLYPNFNPRHGFKNIFKYDKNELGELNHKEFVWDKNSDGSGRSPEQLRQWFRSIKGDISIQLVFDVFDKSVQIFQDFGDVDPGVEKTILKEIEQVQSDISQVKSSIGNPAVLRRDLATIEDLKLLTHRWYKDVVEPDSSRAIASLQSEIKTLFAKTPIKDKSSRYFANHVRDLGSAIIADLQTLIFHFPQNLERGRGWLLELFSKNFTTREQAEIWLKANHTGQENRGVVKKLFEYLFDKDNSGGLNAPGMKKTWREMVSSGPPSIHQIIQDVIDKPNGDMALNARFRDLLSTIKICTEIGSHEQSFSLQSKKYIDTRLKALEAQRYAFDPNQNILKRNKDLPFDHGQVTASGGNTVVNDALGFSFKAFYPDDRKDVWIVSGSNSEDLESSPLPANQLDIIKRFSWTSSQNTGAEIQIIRLVTDIIADDDSTLTKRDILMNNISVRIRMLVTVFIFYDLTQMVEWIKTNQNNANDEVQNMIEDNTKGGLRGFLPLLETFHRYVESSMVHYMADTSADPPTAFFKLLTENQHLMASVTIIKNTLNSKVIQEEAHRKSLSKSAVRQLIDGFEINLVKAFDEYLEPFTEFSGRKLMRGGVNDDNVTLFKSLIGTFYDGLDNDSIMPSRGMSSMSGTRLASQSDMMTGGQPNTDQKNESYIRRVLGTFYDELDAILPDMSWSSLDETPITGEEDQSQALDVDELRSNIDTLNEADIDQKLAKIGELRQRLAEMKQDNNISTSVRNSFGFAETELSQAELILEEKKKKLAMGASEKTANDHLLQTVKDLSSQKQALTEELVETKIKALIDTTKHNLTYRTAFATLKRFPDPEVDESGNHKNSDDPFLTHAASDNYQSQSFADSQNQPQNNTETNPGTYIPDSVPDAVSTRKNMGLEDNTNSAVQFRPPLEHAGDSPSATFKSHTMTDSAEDDGNVMLDSKSPLNDTLLNVQSSMDEFSDQSDEIIQSIQTEGLRHKALSEKNKTLDGLRQQWNALRERTNRNEDLPEIDIIRNADDEALSKNLQEQVRHAMDTVLPRLRNMTSLEVPVVDKDNAEVSETIGGSDSEINHTLLLKQAIQFYFFCDRLFRLPEIILFTGTDSAYVIARLIEAHLPSGHLTSLLDICFIATDRLPIDVDKEIPDSGYARLLRTDTRIYGEALHALGIASSQTSMTRIRSVTYFKMMIYLITSSSTPYSRKACIHLNNTINQWGTLDLPQMIHSLTLMKDMVTLAKDQVRFHTFVHVNESDKVDDPSYHFRSVGDRINVSRYLNKNDGVETLTSSSYKAASNKSRTEYIIGPFSSVSDSSTSASVSLDRHALKTCLISGNSVLAIDYGPKQMTIHDKYDLFCNIINDSDVASMFPRVQLSIEEIVFPPTNDTILTDPSEKSISIDRIKSMEFVAADGHTDFIYDPACAYSFRPSIPSGYPCRMSGIDTPIETRDHEYVNFYNPDEIKRPAYHLIDKSLVDVIHHIVETDKAIDSSCARCLMTSIKLMTGNAMPHEVNPTMVFIDLFLSTSTSPVSFASSELPSLVDEQKTVESLLNTDSPTCRLLIVKLPAILKKYRSSVLIDMERRQILSLIGENVLDMTTHKLTKTLSEISADIFKSIEFVVTASIDESKQSDDDVISSLANQSLIETHGGAHNEDRITLLVPLLFGLRQSYDRSEFAIARKDMIAIFSTLSEPSDEFNESCKASFLSGIIQSHFSAIKAAHRRHRRYGNDLYECIDDSRRYDQLAIERALVLNIMGVPTDKSHDPNIFLDGRVDRSIVDIIYSKVVNLGSADVTLALITDIDRVTSTASPGYIDCDEVEKLYDWKITLDDLIDTLRSWGCHDVDIRSEAAEQIEKYLSERSIIANLHRSILNNQNLASHEKVRDDLLDMTTKRRWPELLQMITSINAGHEIGVLKFSEYVSKRALSECRHALSIQKGERTCRSYRDIEVIATTVKDIHASDLLMNRMSPLPNHKSMGGVVTEDEVVSVDRGSPIFNPQNFDELISQWPGADGRSFSDFLIDSHLYQPNICSR